MIVFMPDGVNVSERFSLLLPFDCKNSSFLSIISGNPRKQRYDEVNLFGIYAPQFTESVSNWKL